jgi:Leu/Phe-tRNA-protein transferase
MPREFLNASKLHIGSFRLCNEACQRINIETMTTGTQRGCRHKQATRPTEWIKDARTWAHRRSS